MRGRMSGLWSVHAVTAATFLPRLRDREPRDLILWPFCRQRSLLLAPTFWWSPIGSADVTIVSTRTRGGLQPYDPWTDLVAFNLENKGRENRRISIRLEG
jgi:hypothetical protein